MAVLALIGLNTALSAQQVKGSCVQDGANIVCDIRLNQVKPISDVTAAVAGTRLEPASIKFFELSARSTAYYFLIQLTAPIARDLLQAVDRLTKENSGKMALGIGTFVERLEERAPIGTAARDIAALKEKILNDVGENNDARVDLYRPALEAVSKLKGLAASFDSGRKALVIFADGRSRHRGDRGEFIKAARENNILVYTIYMSRNGAPGAVRHELEKLAADANGVALSATCPANKTCALDESTLHDIVSYAGQGVRLNFPVSAISNMSELIFNVRLADGTLAQSQPVPIKSEFPLPWWDGAKIWILQNPFSAGGAGAIVLGGLLVLFTGFRMLRRRRDTPSRLDRRTPDARGAGNDTLVAAAVPNPEHVYAWLQFLDAEARRLPLGSINVRIGRHTDNDIVLQNRTVHRKHAILYMRPDRRFTISDLGGENGTVVNGEQVSERDLQDADLIELGEVRMRFFSNDSLSAGINRKAAVSCTLPVMVAPRF